MYIKPLASIFKFPSIGGVPNGRGGTQNENEIENKYVLDIRHYLNGVLKI